MTTVLARNAARSTIDLLLTRASAVKLCAPGPTRADLETILKAAVTAPDHGRVRPWRFIVIEGEGRHRLGELMAEVQRKAKPDIPADELDKTRRKALRAPVVIVVACKTDPTHMVPIIEQQFAAAAAGAQLMLAAKALGFGSNWKTGAVAHDPLMLEGLGLGPNDSVVGLFYIGTEPQPSPLPRATIDEVVQYWDVE